MTDKLKKSERERIVFNHLKGIDDPAYEVIETKHGKYIVRPKQIQLEEEEAVEEESKSEPEEVPPPPVVKQTKQVKRRTKQDAKRILDALTHLIEERSDDDEDDEDDEADDTLQAPPLVEPNNYNPTNLSFKRRRLAF